MKKQILLVPVCVLAASCASMDRSTAVVDDAGYTHYTMSMESDRKGSNYFPEKRQATGKKYLFLILKLRPGQLTMPRVTELKPVVLQGEKIFVRTLADPVGQ